MPINSAMYSVGWRRPERPLTPAKAYKRLPPEWRRTLTKIGLPSVPGRTARLKAINLLQIAAEVEHALMAQYLYAAYSLDETFEQGTGETTRVVDRWKRDIRDIARQEMGHFITVQNLLISLGAEVYVNRENNFSEHPDAYPFPVRFERLSLDALARYVVAESPASEQGLDKKTKRQLKEIHRLTKEKVKTAIHKVGILYAVLYWLFMKNDQSQGHWPVPSFLKRLMKIAKLNGVHIKDTDFVSTREYEEFHATRNEWGVFEDSLHVDDTDPRSRALGAIHFIMQQGEGPSGAACSSNNDSHFCRFLKIYEDLKDNPRLAEAARPVPTNPIVRSNRRTEPVKQGSQSITHPESRLWATLFNIRYQILLLDMLLSLSMSRRGQDKDLRKQLTWAAANEMQYLKLIGQLLPTLPRGTGRSGSRAGAPFETALFPPDNTKRWDQQRVLIKGSQQVVQKLRKMVSPHDLRFELLRDIAAFDHKRKQLVETRSSLIRVEYEWRGGANQRIPNRK